MKFILALAFLAVAVTAARFDYEGFKVYRVTPKDQLQFSMLAVLKTDAEFDFWSTPRGINQDIDVMVSPKRQEKFEQFLADHKYQFSVIIQNVESVVSAERTRSATAPKVGSGKITFTEYHRYTAIQDYLAQLASTYEVVSTMSIGKTSEGRDLSILKISTGGSGKPAIMVDAGIHAREWIAPAMALYIINQLVENSANSAMIENVDWFIVPVLNPDGYEYSHTEERFWRKTRSAGQICDGVDGNRNFEFHWMENGASDYECDETYAGPTYFSEPEMVALRDFMLENKDSIKMYLTFHSYGQYLLYPWGYTSTLPDDADELQALAENVDDAIASVQGTRYTIGSSTNVLYAAAGGSDDWAKGMAGVQLSYTIELPGGGSWGFDLPASRITEVVTETWEGVKVYHDYVLNKFGFKKQ